MTWRHINPLGLPVAAITSF